MLSAQLLSQVGVTVGLHYSITHGDFLTYLEFPTCSGTRPTGGGGGYKQSIPAARRTDIIKPGYPGLEAVEPGFEKYPRVCIP